MNENEKNPLLNMQRIMQESKELSEASTNELGEKPEKKVKKERTVNARLKHEQGTKRMATSNEENTAEAGQANTTEEKSLEKKPVRRTGTRKTKTAESKRDAGISEVSEEMKKTGARYVAPDRNVPSLAEQVSSILMENTNKKRRGRAKKASKKIKIIPLGGLEQIGMNITAFEYEDSIMVVDCGLAFPSDDMLGIDLVIPDITYLKDNYLKVKGFCITHGHEDHIGALPYILKQLNVPVYGTDNVAQYAIALLLEACSHIGHHDRSVHAGEWTKSIDFCYWQRPLIEVSGKTVGIIGFGRIGQAVARILRAMNVRVLAYSRTERPEGRALADYVPLDDLIAQADFIFLHCPLTPETDGIINAARIAQMKDGVIIVNNGRGQLIVEEDLAAALTRGKVGGAAVDVASSEPIAADNPLLHAPNCIITPHISWATKEARERIMQMTANNVRAFMDGKPTNVVN